MSPAAFTAEGLREIHARVAPEPRIALATEDAALLAANAVNLGDDIVMSRCSDELRRRLERARLSRPPDPARRLPRSGGSAFCLTLRLDNRSDAIGRSTIAERAPALALSEA